MMLTRLDMIRGLKRLHEIRASDPIQEELRGWYYYSPPVKPRAYLSLSISDVAYAYCPTKRDVYLRKVTGSKGNYEKPQIINGTAIHKVFYKASKDVWSVISLGKDPIESFNSLVPELECPQNLQNYCIKLYKYLTMLWLSEVAKARSSYGGESIGLVPWLSEVRVDGSMLGLSNRLSIDALADFSLIEIKTGKQEDFHKLGVVGYALAIESSMEIPIDYGFLIYVNGFNRDSIEISTNAIYISSDLRKEFLDRRDDVIDMILSEKDPGMPASCPDSCPFIEVCKK